MLAAFPLLQFGPQPFALFVKGDGGLLDQSAGRGGVFGLEGVFFFAFAHDGLEVHRYLRPKVIGGPTA